METRCNGRYKHIAVSCTAVRVPTMRAHAEAISIETMFEVTPEEARWALDCGVNKAHKYKTSLCLFLPRRIMLLRLLSCSDLTVDPLQASAVDGPGRGAGR
jgi:aspartate-semialdehyde dehydrogenase